MGSSGKGWSLTYVDPAVCQGIAGAVFDGKFFLWDPYNTSPKLTYTAAMDVAGILHDWLGLEGKDLRL